MVSRGTERIFSSEMEAPYQRGCLQLIENH